MSMPTWHLPSVAHAHARAQIAAPAEAHAEGVAEDPLLDVLPPPLLAPPLLELLAPPLLLELLLLLAPLLLLLLLAGVPVLEGSSSPHANVRAPRARTTNEEARRVFMGRAMSRSRAVLKCRFFRAFARTVELRVHACVPAQSYGARQRAQSTARSSSIASKGSARTRASAVCVATIR